jgi:hypothetical protein
MSEQHEHEMNSELERALKSVRPAPAYVDGITAAFNAGRRSTRRALRTWQSVAAATLLLAIGSWALPAHQTQSHEREPTQVTQTMVPSLSPQSLGRLQQAVNEHGIDALPPTNIAAAHAMRADNL